MSALKNLGINAKRLRVELGWSQEALAERAGLEYKHYQKIETGKWPGVYLETAEAIAKALRVSMGELLDAQAGAPRKVANLPGGRPKHGSSN